MTWPGEFNSNEQLKRQQAIADEYGESFVEVVMGFRKQGCSWKTIAGTLEVPHSTLKFWRKQLGIGDNEIIADVPRKSDIRRKAIELGYRNIEAMIIDYWTSGRMEKELAADLGCMPQSVYRHMPEDLRGNWASDPSQRKNNGAGGYRGKPRSKKWSLNRYSD